MHPGTRDVGKVCKHIRARCHGFQVLLMNTLLKQRRESTSPEWAANMQKLDSRSATVHTQAGVCGPRALGELPDDFV